MHSKSIHFNISSYYFSINPIAIVPWFAHHKAGLSQNEINVILIARKPIIKSEFKSWVCINTSGSFLIVMESSHSAQLADLYIYSLYEMADQFPNISGALPWNDCLLYLQNVFNQKLQKIKNRLVKCFRDTGSIIIFDDNI